MDEPATVLRAPRSDVDRVVAETSLAECTDKLVADLSGGQHHRVSLAVALDRHAEPP